MERRNFVIGLGGIAASAGLIAGSGAFSQIEADRTMSVTVADDANAYLSLAEGTGNSTFTSLDADGNIQLAFAGLNTANGTNDNAVTSFDSLVEVGNNGDSQVTLGYTVRDSGNTDVTGDVSLYTGSAGGTDLAGQKLAAYDSSTSTKDVLEFGVQMDTNVVADGAYTITISATQA